MRGLSFWRPVALVAIPALLLALVVPAVTGSSRALAQSTTAVITPASGPAGSKVTGSGTNWIYPGQVQAVWNDTGSNLGSPVAVASNDTFKDPNLTIPSGAPLGTQQILFVEDDFLIPANFDVTQPTIGFSPSASPVGTSFSVTGNGWCPSDTVAISLPYGSPGIFYGQASWPANSSGNWQQNITVGWTTPPGTYEFYFTQTACNGLQVTGTFTVPVPTWPGTTGPSYANKYYGYPYTDPPACTDGGACWGDQWNFIRGQCTSWVAYRLNELNGILFSNTYRLPAGSEKTWGDASNWEAAADAIGITVNGTPALGSVAWYSSGHVAYVEQVNSPTSVVISEMNYDYDNGFRVRTITTAVGGGWPTAFIHIADR